MYKLNLIVTKNNVFITVLDSKTNRLVYSVSSGILGFKGSARRTEYAASSLGKLVGNWLVNQKSFVVDIVVKVKTGREITGVVKGLGRCNIVVNNIYFVNCLSHNGVRRCRPRRK